jgi:hypothetical protein
MRRLVLLLLPLSACAPDLPPEQIAAARAEALVRKTQPDATLLAPIAGLDGEGKPGICGLVETRAGPVRVVVALGSGEVRTGVPAAQGGHRGDLGESRYCSDDARKRWEQVKRVDPVGLVARVEAQAE